MALSSGSVTRRIGFQTRRIASTSSCIAESNSPLAFLFTVTGELDEIIFPITVWSRSHYVAALFCSRSTRCLIA